MKCKKNTLGADLNSLEKAYTKKEQAALKKHKKSEYGKEDFAVPGLNSYPLTKNGRPSEERTKAAWRYINEVNNTKKLGKKRAAAAKHKIRAFAQKHFHESLNKNLVTKSMQGDRPRKPSLTSEMYVFPETRLWRLSKGLEPDPIAVRDAWRAVHSTNAHQLLDPEVLEIAEFKILQFAEDHDVDLSQPEVKPIMMM